MSADEAANYEKDLDFKTYIEMRSWDEQAKVSRK